MIHNQIAQFALRLVSKATAGCDDMTQQAVADTKAWLKAICTGQLIVSEAPKPEEQVASPAAQLPAEPKQEPKQEPAE